MFIKINMETKDKLKREIAEAKLRLKQLEKQEKNFNRNNAIKKLSEYTNEEKIKFFDEMYKNALLELKEVEKSKYHNENCVQYAWESYIQILMKNHDLFWNYWNSLPGNS